MYAADDMQYFAAPATVNVKKRNRMMQEEMDELPLSTFLSSHISCFPPQCRDLCILFSFTFTPTDRLLLTLLPTLYPFHFKSCKMCVFELTTYINCSHTWLSHVEPCADEGSANKCRLTHKPFILVNKTCDSCQNKKEMAKQEEVDPSLKVAQGVYDNLALPTVMFETKTHHYTPNQLQYLAMLRKDVGICYDVEGDVEMIAQEPTAPSLPSEFPSSSPHPSIPHHVDMDSFGTYCPDLEELEMFDALFAGSDLAGKLGGQGGKAVLQNSPVAVQKTPNDRHASAQNDPRTSDSWS